jgi:50S ribosomal subunit-associated GTPase HflX
MDEKTLLQLKNKVDRAKEEKSRAEGALQQLRARLKEEFSVSTEEEAEDLLQQMRDELATVNKELEKVVADMEERYGR